MTVEIIRLFPDDDALVMMVDEDVFDELVKVEQTV